MTTALEYTKELIRIPSVSGNEKNCLEYVHAWMQAAGLSDLVITKDYVAGYKKGKESGAALILTGHVDTVSEGKQEAWQTNPWEPIVDGDKLYGLGGSDMKGGVAAAMAAIESIVEPAVDTWLAVVSNEEVDGSGTAAFADYFAKHYHYDAASAIIPEPTNFDRIEVGHRGNAFVTLTFHGQAGHGSQQASFAPSALGLAANFLSDIDTIAAALVVAFADPVLGNPTIVPTGAAAGSPASPNKTADEADITIDIRTTPALDVALPAWLAQLAETYGCTWQYAANPVASCVCEPTVPIIKKVQEIVGKIPTVVSHGATDQGFLQAIGIDTIVFGPGEFENAHSQNEWVSCSKVEKTAELFTALIGNGQFKK